MKKSNLILGFYVGIISLCVATVSMSIAWYASSTQVRLEAIEMTVDCDRDLVISTERDGKYVSMLEPKDLIDSGLFKPVTTAHSDKWMNEKRDMPVFYDETKYSTHESADLLSIAETGFYSQKLYLMSDDDIFVTIGYDNTYIKANEEYNKGYAEILYEEYQNGNDDDLKALTVDTIETRLNNLVNAMRYSILITDADEYSYVIIDPHKHGETEYGGLLDNDIDHYYDYFFREPHHQPYERVYGDYIGEIYYSEAKDTDSAYKYPNEDPNAFNARHKAGVNRFDFDTSVELGGFEYKKENSIDLEDFKKEEKPLRIPLYRNQPKEIVLSIYIEGWDLDSINHTKGATFISNLEFKIEREQ